MATSGDDDIDAGPKGAPRGAIGSASSRPERLARRPKSDAKKIRISLVFEPEAGPILEWMMKLSSAPTKADLFRKALDHYEQFLVEREERRTRLGARRPD